MFSGAWHDEMFRSARLWGNMVIMGFLYESTKLCDLCDLQQCPLRRATFELPELYKML